MCLIFRLQIVTKNGCEVKNFQPCASGMCATCKARCLSAWLQFGSGASWRVSFIVIGLAQEQPGHWASSLILCQTGTSDRAGKLCWQPKTNDLLTTSLALFEDSCWCLASVITPHPIRAAIQLAHWSRRVRPRVWTQIWKLDYLEKAADLALPLCKIITRHFLRA